MADSIFMEFLEQETREARRLAEQSDVLTLVRVPIPFEGLFLAEFKVPYLVLGPDGAIDVAPGPVGVMIRMEPDYLLHVDPLGFAQIREPQFFHPNHRWPALCVGEVRPATSLRHALTHLYDIICYRNYATDDALDPVAAYRLREEPEVLDRLPKPPRLVRRKLELSCELIEG